MGTHLRPSAQVTHSGRTATGHLITPVCLHELRLALVALAQHRHRHLLFTETKAAAGYPICVDCVALTSPGGMSHTYTYGSFVLPYANIYSHIKTGADL